MDRVSLLRILPLRSTSTLISSKQTIPEIRDEVLEAHVYYAKDYDLIADEFERRDLSQTFRDLWFFLKNNLRYRMETEKKQTTKSPAWILYDGIGDCKHYSLFIAGVLNVLQRKGRKFDWWFAFASYDPGETQPGHVFVIAEWNNRKYWIDPVLNAFNERLKPDFLYQLQPKNYNMALYRIGGVMDYDTTVTDPAILDNEDRELSTELLSSIQLLLHYGVLNTRGQVNDRLLISLHGKIPADEYKKLASARVYLQQQAIGGFFSTIVRGIKKVALFPIRNAYLLLVNINAFGFATKLKNGIWDKNGGYTTLKDKVKDLWQNKFGGDWTNLENTIKRGAQKKAILGVAPAAVPAWVATAAAVIAAIMPLVNAFLKQAQQTGDPNINLYDPAMYPYGVCADGFTPKNADGSCTVMPTGSGGSGIMSWIQQNPIPTLGIAAAGYYFFIHKK